MYICITKYEVTSYNRCIVHAIHEMNQLGHGLSVTEAVCCHLNYLPCDVFDLLILYSTAHVQVYKKRE